MKFDVVAKPDACRTRHDQASLSSTGLAYVNQTSSMRKASGSLSLMLPPLIKRAPFFQLPVAYTSAEVGSQVQT